jgi:transcriptional regulator
MAYTAEDIESALVGDDPVPGINLSNPGRVLKRQALDELMARAMSGLLPRNRELKSWEPDMLDERHITAICMRASGLQQGVIAKALGWTESWTSIVLNHPDAQYILTKIVSYAADEVLDIQTRIKAHAGEALDKVVEVMRTTQDQRLASANAFEILKMAGYSAVEKKDVKVTTISVPIESANLLSAAIQESSAIRAIPGVDYRVTSSSVPGSVGSESPATSANSGRQGSDQPPVSGSQVSEETLHDGSRVRVA